MALILRTFFMRDLRGNWVFPRLAYAATPQAIDRNLRSLVRFFISRPINRFLDLLTVLEDHQTGMEILLALFALTIALMRAAALLAITAGTFFLAIRTFF